MPSLSAPQSPICAELQSVHQSLASVGQELLDALNSLNTDPNTKVFESSAILDGKVLEWQHRNETEAGPQRSVLLSKTRERLSDIGDELRSAVETSDDFASRKAGCLPTKERTEIIHVVTE